ncbi:SNARE-binding exocyst subunit S6 [Coelomomyces lativittatus]|nr:SNARE-binding exocyst subunit S6 [Coelomomyces lativittatus]KAJ1516015.1 SNARE-binding exocyst subunit S6 [Coelomomyces lativittatus]KAJ1517929.1 SNARE-binding exocyst subunit S6 [Coelomomyces lativittatus]
MSTTTSTPLASRASREHSKQEAIEKLSLLLKYPDDLDTKLVLLRSKFISEKAAIDAQLKAGMQGQLDDCQLGLDHLSSVRDHMHQTQAHCKTILVNGEKSVNMIPNFSKLQKIALIYHNFHKTNAELKKFEEVKSRCERVKANLDAHKKDPSNPTYDILRIHYETFFLEAFYDQTLYQVESANKEIQMTVKHFFEQLNEVSLQFRTYLWSLAKNMMELVKRNQGSLLVKLAKIIECEEKADEEVYANDLVSSTAPTSKSTMGTPAAIPGGGGGGGGFNSSSSSNATTTNMTNSTGGQGSHASLTGSTHSDIKSMPPPRTIKSYRSQFFDALHESISEKFKSMKLLDDIPGFLESIKDMVVDDLTFVFDNVIDLFPKKYKMFPFYVLEYHRHVYDLLNKIILEKMDTGTILFVLKWSKEYYSEMNSKLGISEELLEPRLLDGQETVLVEDYLKLIRQKLDEWMKNLLMNETKEFVEREHPPEIDSQGKYGLSASMIVFNMINQQIDVGLESSKGQLLLDVVKECKRILVVYQTHFSQLLDTELKKFHQDATKIPGGIVEYTMALANDAMKSTEFVELIIKRLDVEVEERFRAPVAAELNAAMDGFMKLSKSASSHLVDAAFMDVKSAFTLVFTIPVWYNDEVMNDIIATLKDYFLDFQEHLIDYLYGKLITDAMDRFLIQWIDALKSKNAKFKVPGCWTRMESDLKKVIEFFSTYKSTKRVEKHFIIMDKLFTIICANRKMVFLDFYAMWKLFNDVPAGFIEDLLSKRDDLEKSQFKEIVDSIKQKMKEDPPVDSQKSIFSLINSNAGSK